MELFRIALFTMFFIIVGLLLIIRGWNMVTLKQMFWLPGDLFGLWIIRVTKGKNEEEKRRVELSSQQRMYKLGIFTIITGGMALVSGLILSYIFLKFIY